jgi:hypothetical protein
VERADLADSRLIPEQETRMTAEPVAAETGRDFIRDIIQADLDAGTQPDRDALSA